MTAGSTHLRRPQASRRRRAYVLVVTLAVLVLASTLLVGLGRLSMRHAADARAADADLQRRWGSASCRQTILPLAEQILDAEERRRGAAVPQLSTTIMLGGQRFEVILADEQAKADVNAMLAEQPAETVQSHLQRGLTGYGVADKIRLRPETGVAATPNATTPASADRPPPIGSHGQIFDSASPELWLRPPAGGGAAPGELLTCWSGGRLNIRRTSEPVLQLALSPPLSTTEIARLIESRDRVFYGGDSRPAFMPVQPSSAGQARSPLRRVMEQSGLSGSSGRIVGSLSDGSTRHSLWVVSSDGRRRHYTFAVLDSTQLDRPRWIVRSW